MMKFIKGFLIGVQFLTAIPIKRSFPMDDEHVEKTIQSFPLLGLVQGIFYSALLYGLMEWTYLSPLAIAFMIWLATIIITGGIHIDGWMDMSDAYFSYQDKEKRLEIMSDPRTGAFGVISLLVLLSSRFLFIFEITNNLSLLSFVLISFIPFLSKTVMGIVLLHVPAAKKGGLASFFKKAGRKSTLYIYPVYVVLLLGGVALIDRSLLLPSMLVVLVACGCFFIIRQKSIRHFGGITGDVLGASVEGCENLLWMTLWLLHYFVMV